MSYRTDLAQARIELRTAQDNYELVRAQAEQRIIDAAGGEKELGSNAEARARSLLVQLHQDDQYNRALFHLRRCQQAVDELQARVDEEIDHRRALDRRSRDKVADALIAIATQPTRKPADVIAREAAELFS